MLGDNRDNSTDSRAPSETGVGLVPLKNFIGRADYIYFSRDDGAATAPPKGEARRGWGVRLQRMFRAAP